MITFQATGSWRGVANFEMNILVDVQVGGELMIILQISVCPYMTPFVHSLDQCVTDIIDMIFKMTMLSEIGLVM